MALRLQVLETFTTRMIHSGYSREQVRHCVVSGLTTYEKRKTQAELQGVSIFRGRDIMDRNREVNNILEKTTWFLDKPREEVTTSIPRSGGGRSFRKRNHLTSQQKSFQPAAVLFVPRTDGGLLLTELRKVDTNLQGVTGKSYRRVKLIEEGGQKLKNILTQSDSWGKFVCNHPQCSSCLGVEGQPGACRAQNVVYQISA